MNIKDLVTGIQHIGIPTNNISKTIDFYKKLGFEVTLETTNEVANEKVAFLKNNDLVIETYENNNAKMKDGAVDHICLNVIDVESAFNALKNAAVLLDAKIQFLPFWENGVRFFTILGPNNEKIEFCQRL